MKKSKRITRDEWLQTALQLLASTGEGGLHVEKLAREIGVAKSGFYCHFKDRDDLLQQIFNYWCHEYTEVVIENSLLLMSPPRQRLLMIATYVFEQNLTEFDAAMQVWSKKDAAIGRRFSALIRKRLNFVGNAFQELGFDDDEALIRARIFLGYIASQRGNFGNNAKLAAQSHELLVEKLTAG